MKGNLAPVGAVAKITGKEGIEFTGAARCFNSEEEFVAAFDRGEFKIGEKVVVVLRFLGPRGGPGKCSCNVDFLGLSRGFCEGMPEMLKPTSLVMGAGLGNDVAFVTDGRFSGG